MATLLPSKTEIESGNMRHTENVTVVSLNTIIAQNRIPNKHDQDPDIFLMKLDVEGAEMKVITQDYELWKRRRVKFLVFEYSKSVWEVSGSNLWYAQKFMFARGYMCFIITPDRMLPIFHLLYEDIYASLVWSNVFCGHMDDPDLLDFLSMYHPSDTEVVDMVKDYLEILNGSDKYGP